MLRCMRATACVNVDGWGPQPVLRWRGPQPVLKATACVKVDGWGPQPVLRWMWGHHCVHVVAIGW